MFSKSTGGLNCQVSSKIQIEFVSLQGLSRQLSQKVWSLRKVMIMRINEKKSSCNYYNVINVWLQRILLLTFTILYRQNCSIPRSLVTDDGDQLWLKISEQYTSSVSIIIGIRTTGQEWDNNILGLKIQMWNDKICSISSRYSAPQEWDNYKSRAKD